MSNSLETLLHRTFQAGTEGLYVRANGLPARARSFRGDAEGFVRAILRRDKWARPLQAAFADYVPFEDEICVFAKSRLVATNRRVFLLTGNKLSRPPIPLDSLEDYDDGFGSGAEVLTLTGGEEISRPDILGNPDADVMRKLILASKSGDSSKLHDIQQQPHMRNAQPTQVAGHGPTFMGEFVPIAWGLAAFFVVLIWSADDILSDPVAPLIYGVAAGFLGVLTAKQVRSALQRRDSQREERSGTKSAHMDDARSTGNENSD